MTTKTMTLVPRVVNARASEILKPHDGDGARRAVIELSGSDYSTYGASKNGVTAKNAPGEWVPVTDVRTGQPIQVRVASCGLNCVCDMEVKA